VKSPINLESPQQALQTFPNAGGQGTQRGEKALFNAILNNHMRISDVNVATDKEQNADMGQGLADNAATLMNLAPAVAAQQLKTSAKPGLPAQEDSTKKLDTGDSSEDPILAMWIATIVPMPVQLNAPVGKSDIAAQLTGAGLVDPHGVPTNTLMLPKLIPPTTDVPVLKPAPAPADLHAEALAKDSQPATVVPVVETPAIDLAHCIAALTATSASPSSKASVATDKNKNDRQDLSTTPALQNSKPDAPPPAVQSQDSDSKPQSQTSSDSQQNHSGNDSKKNSNSIDQLQSAGQSQNVAGTTQVDQTNLNAAATQASVHGGTSSAVQTHTVSSVDVNHALNVREPGGIATPESAPRIVHAAKLMEAAGQAEMRVSMKSETGTVDVRATLEGSHLSATVAAQHSGTRDWLLSNLHELHSTLSRDDLNLRTFEVTDTALQNEGRQTQSGQQEQQKNLGAPAQFRKDGRNTTEVFSDLDTSETASQALSLHA
jgi:hypothetical protein